MKKIFIEHNIPKIVQINLPTGRLYETPLGKKYPSVTTVLGVESADYLTEWRERVGTKAADEISRKAAARGTKIHKACENTLLSGYPFTWSVFDIATGTKEMFEALVPVLESIEEVHAMETQLYSDALATAGTVDLICRIDNELTVLDWKTSGRYKSRDDIHSYFKQCAFYSQAFWSLTDIVVPNITIAMTVEDYGLILFKEKTRKWLPEFIETRQKFQTRYGY